MQHSIELPYTVRARTLEEVEDQFDISDVSDEIRERIGATWILVLAEKNLSKFGEETGVKDVALQVAFGNPENVLTCDIDTIEKATQERVKLRLYFVEIRILRTCARHHREVTRRNHEYRSAQQAH